MTENFWEAYERTVQAESGGGGIVAECVIETGYKAYVSGPQEDSFFPCGMDDESKAAAKAAADAAARAGGRERSRLGIQIRCKRDGAYSGGNPATWQGDRFFNADSWTEAAKDVVVPSLKEHDIRLPYTGWCRVGFQPDPYKKAQGEAGMTDTDQNGNPRFPQVAYITETFDDQDAAYAAIGVTEDQPAAASAGAPKGWDEATWNSVVPDIVASDKTPAALATEYGVSVADIVRARNS